MFSARALVLPETEQHIPFGLKGVAFFTRKGLAKTKLLIILSSLGCLRDGDVGGSFSAQCLAPKSNKLSCNDREASWRWC